MHRIQRLVLLFTTLSCLTPLAVMAQQESGGSAPAADNTGSTGGFNANTGLSNDSIIGNGNMQADDVGVAVNGAVRDSNLNNNQNALLNQNQTVVRPVIVAPSQAGGGNSALVMPRNPLALPNASLGRSNFGLQFGVQNNPGLAALTGGDNALGWFLQAGLTIPFGKIPDVYRNPNSSRLDDMRRQQQAENRRVFDQAGTRHVQGYRTDRKVQGRVVGLSAYNVTTAPSARLEAPTGPSLSELPAVPQPRVLALAPADVYNRPLNTGERIGLVEVGREYPYLGHTRSGWVKILLPNGTEGWTSTHFEYLKYDFTEIDTLAVDPTAAKARKAEQPVPATRRSGKAEGAS